MNNYFKESFNFFKGKIKDYVIARERYEVKRRGFDDASINKSYLHADRHDLRKREKNDAVGTK